VSFNARWFGLSPYTAEIVQLVTQAEKWGRDCMACRQLELGGLKATPKLLVICGNNGTGKSKTLRGLFDYFRACRMEAWGRGFWKLGPPDVKLADWSRWATLPLTEADGGRPLFEDLFDPDVLLLDDVGVDTDRFRSGEALVNLTTLLTRREGKWTALTTNYLPETWVGTDAAPGRFGKRVGDRLYRDSVIVAIRSTKSWALTQRKP